MASCGVQDVILEGNIVGFDAPIEIESRQKYGKELKGGSGEDQESDSEDFDILQWWKMNAPRFPILATMARDVLAFPFSTVAYESAFSTRGRALNAFRSSLTPRMAQALICAQDWLRAKSVSEEEDFDVLDSMEQEFDKLHLDSTILA
ncbi:hypothetical protein SLEP1_g38349 [Rubroshorea leprosula]|nr:hypothetical protein SLEP1_g38349 [Rubroshorea leprosula]